MANEVNESTKWLYEQLNGKGYNVGKDVNEFDSLMRSNADSRQWAYDTAKKSGLNVGKDIDEFSSLVGGTTTSAPVTEGAPIPANDIQPKTEAEQEAWKPTPMQKAFMIKSVQSSLDDFNNNSNSLIQHTRNMAEYMKHGESIVGQPAKAGLHLNPEAGSVKEAYITPSGYKTTDRGAADNESFNHRRYVDNVTVAGQLRRAGRDLDYLTDKAAKRRAEIIDEVRKRQQGAEATSGLLDKIYQGIRSGDSMTSPSGDFMDEVNDVLATDREYRALEAARREAENRVQTIQHENDRQEDKDVGFWRGLREVVSDSRTWDFGLGDMRDAMTKVAASSKQPENRSDAEHMMIEQAYEAQQAEAAYSQNDSFWNRAGVMTGEMLPFMLDFAIMGGAKSGATTVTRGLDAILLRSIHKTAPKVARNKAVQWTTKALGALPEDLLYRAPFMTNTVQGMKTSADIIDRKLGDVVIRDDGSYDFSNDKTWGSAVWQGEANAIIENYSEMFGPHLEGVLSLKTVGKLADTFGAKRLSGILTKASNSELAGIAGTMQKHLDRLGVSDYFGEVGEEYYGQLWRTMLNLDDAYKQNPDGSRTNLFLDGQFHGDIWGGMALSMGLMGAGKYTLSAAAYGSMKHRVNKTDARASETFTPEVWEGWRERIDGTTNDKVGEMAEAIVADPTLTDEQRTAAMNYMEASLNLRGFNLASVAHQRGGEPSEEEVAANESYMDGYSAETPQEMNDAKRMLALQRQRLASSLSEDVIPEFDADPIGALSRTHDSELRRIASDYVNAKQVYEGMIQRVRDDIDGRIAQSDAMIDSRVNHQTGMIQPATMKIDDRKVYIVNGTVSMFEDGTGVDAQNSSESIIIRDAETGKVEFADPTQFLSIDEAIDVETEKEAAKEQIIDEIAITAANNIDGVLSFTPGDSYSILDAEGNQQPITILGNSVDEEGLPVDRSVDIQYQDGTIQSVVTSELQQLVDAASTQRVEQFDQEREAQRAADEEAVQQADKSGLSNPNRRTDLMPDDYEMPYDKRPVRASQYIESKNGTGGTLYQDENGNDAVVIAAIDDNNYVGYFREYDEQGKPTNRWSAKFQNGSGLRENHRDMMLTAQELLPAGHELTEHTSVSTDGLRNLANQLKHGYELQYDEQGNVITDRVAVNMMARENDLGLLNYNPGSEELASASYRDEAHKADIKARLAQFLAPFGLGKEAITWEDGTLYVDHPILKRADTPQQEVEPTVIENAKTVPNSAETTEIPTNNRDLDTESVPKTDIPVENIQQTADDGFIPIDPEIKPDENGVINIPSPGTAEVDAMVASEESKPTALSKIPTDQNGEPIYEQAEPADAWDAIVESAKGNEDKAQRVVESMVGDMEAEVKRLEKQKPNKGRTIAEKMAAEDALEEARTIAQSNLSKWKAIAGVRESRITEAQRLEAEAELKRQIEAEQEARRIERQARDEERASRPGEYAKAMSAWEEPTSIEERILRDLSSGGIKLRWSDKGKTRGLGAHLFGGSNTERRWNGEYGNYKWLVDDNAGLLPEEYAERLSQEYYNDYENDSDHYAETFGTVLDILGSYSSSKDMWERAQELHQGNLEAQASAEDFERMEMEARGITEEDIERDRIYREKFGMPEDEWDEFYSSNGTEIDMPDEEYSEYFNNLAGLRADQENEQQGLQQTATDTGEQGRTDTVSENSTGMVRDAWLYRPEASEVWQPEGNNQESGGDVSLRDDEGNGEKGNIIQSSPSDINLEEQDAEEDVLRSRIEVKDDDWTEGNGYTPTLKRTIIIDGTHNVTQVDTPNDKGDYTGSVFEYDGKAFGDLQEVISHIDNSQPATIGEQIAEAEAEVNTAPTDKQKEAGNYKKGHVQVGAFDVSIENPKGSKRSGTDADGKKWETEMKHTYGYIRGTKGVDGDHIDVFISSDVDAWNGRKAFVVDQYNPDGSFDEHKVMLGFNDRDEAFGAYLSNYESGWENGRRLDVTAVNLEDFEKWIDSSKRKTKPFAEYKSVKSKEAHSMVGRALSEHDATDLIAQMEANAEIAPATELTPENWITQFGEDGTVDTPLGVVKMGANQLLKLYSLKRTEYFGMIHPTLNSPDVIIEKNAPAVGAERNSKYLFVKTFIKSDGSRLVHFESVTVKRDGMEVSISSHEAEGKAIKKEMQNGKILHLSERLSSGSERYLTETPSVSEGPDLVPTSDNNIVETPEPTDKRTGTDDNPMDKRGDTALQQDSVVSSGKGNTLSADKQGSGVESSEDYAIKSKPYTNKQGKTLDTYLVTFNRDFSKQEKSSLRKMAKDKKGWYDKETGGWMLRSREDADAFAKNVMSKNDTQLSAEAPLSIDNMKASAKIHNEITPKEPTSPEIISGPDLSKLDESLRNEIMDYISEYPCAPLMVISNNGDINNLNMPDWFKEELKEEVSQGNTIAGYCNLDKKIYIFANAEKACPTHETLLHENTHAIVDELGDDCLGFLTSFKEIVAQLSFNNGVFQVILDGIKEEYVEEKVSNEFLAYSLQYAARYPEVLNRIKQALDPKTLEYLEVKILNRLYGQRNESQKSEIRKDVHETFSGVREEDAKNIPGTQSGDRGQSSEADSESSQGAEQSETEVEAISLKNSSGNKLVTDEQYAELLVKMRKKMGGQLNMGVDPEILAIGSMMAVYHIERGARKFAEYVKAMVADLGEKFPARYLKGFYKAAHEMIEDAAPEIAEEMDSDNVVSGADIASILSGRIDAMATAEMVVAEGIAEQERQEAEKKLKEDRNKRLNSDGSTTEAIDEGNIKTDVTSGDFIPGVRKNKGRTELVGQSEEPKKKKISKKSVSSQSEQPNLFGDSLNKQTPETTDRNGQERIGKENREILRETPRTDSGAPISLGTREMESGLPRRRDDREGDRGIPQGAGNELGSTQRPPRRLPRLNENERRNTRNNRAERGTDYAPKGDDARIKANIAAIELAQRLTESGEQATPEQMETLRKFSGWGGLGKAFTNKAYADRIRALLGDSYQDAVDSRKSAYYTPAAIIDSLWDIAKAMGFQGGTILEGSAGIGNILGLMPQDISEHSDIKAVEVDSTTGSILSLLYPDAQVDIQGFEETKIENGSIDLAITNVPFITGWNVIDKTGDKDLSKKFKDIHDFCIAKNIRKLREGGIGIFITSSGTLDNSAKLRAWVTNEGNSDVVGAFRLHNETFGGTGATSDIIVVRKRVNGKESAHAIDVSEVSGVRTAEYDTGETKKVTVDGHKQEVPVVDVVTMDYNRYFVEHPEQMAGEMYFGFEKGETYRAKSKALYPVKEMNQEAMLSAWAQSFSDMDFDAVPTNKQEYETTYDTVGNEVKVGSMVIDDRGRLCVNNGGVARPLMSARKNKQDTRTDDELISMFNSKKIKGRTRQQCLKDYNGIKKALADVLEYQTTHEDNEGLEPLLSRLNATFDSFVSRYGNLHKNNQLAWLRNDVDYPGILALETYEERGDESGNRIKKFGKTDIFSRRVVEKETIPQPKNIKDGIITSLYISGRVDVGYISEQLGINEKQVREEIISSGLGFENPVSREMEVSYEYLSGNVREKLRQATANNTDGKYDANIKALEKVVPMNIPAHLIEFALGSSWIEPQLYEDYVKERTGVNVNLTNVGGTWFMKTSGSELNTEQNRSQGVYSKELEKTVFGHEILEAAITNRSISVSRTYKRSDGTFETITDRDATQAVAAKVDEFRMDFKDWARAKMQGDMEMSARMETVYNDRFNNSVPRSIPDEFIPKHFGGQVTEMGGRPFSLRPHQAKAVIRGTTQSHLLAHEVGTGKTFTLICTAMEMRRLGTARKPMIVVQNATVGQFVESAKALYPNAKVLTLEDADRNAQGRKDFYAKIRYNDWDMIVIPQSVLDMIPDSEERQIRFIQDKIAEKMLVLQQMAEQDPDGSSWITKQAEKEISDLENDLAKITASLESKRKEKSEKDMKKEAQTRHNAEVRAMEMLDRTTDDVENFDQMGIDALLVDEAHEYKHLGFATAMQRGVKGVDPSYSKKAQGLYLKTQAVMERNRGRNVIFATGTPISNTAAEIWTFMRYLMPEDEMRDYGIYYFDDFVRNFGNLQQMLEFATNGKFKENNRFTGYVNLPELVRIWSTVTDTVLTREAGGVSDKIPDMEGGKAQDIYLPQTKALRSVMLYVKSELDRYDNMTGKEKKANSHIPLTMYGIAKAAAVDARLVYSDAADEPKSKTNEAVRQTLRSLEETDNYKGTVAIFADNYQNKQSGFNLYEDIRRKLIEQGVPAEQIVVMKSGMTVKKKLEIFDKVNAGEVRVILGSTYTLGTGVNIQERLHTLIHLDAPNRPMDYTQRNGRILRQGNLHKDMGLPVRVLRFGVDDSLDVTAYQRLKTKGAIADSIMNGSKMMENSMETRSLEEDEDVFGDITAQLSGSEYAMLKNQAEKEVRKLNSKLKQWEADQTYIHNQIPRLTGQIRENEKRQKTAQENLDVVRHIFPNGTFKTITIGKQTFSDLESMNKFFTEHNKSVMAMSDQIRDNKISGPQTRKLTIDVDGLKFEVTTIIDKEIGNNGGNLFSKASRKVTYSCPELQGIEDIPVSGARLKGAVEDIISNVITGKDYADMVEAMQSSIDRNQTELQQIEQRQGKEFEFYTELAEAKERLEEYTEKMKAELAEKEAKYADMDADVEVASDISLTEEDSEETEEEDDVRYRLEEASDRIEELFEEAVAGNLKGKAVEIGRLTQDGRDYLEKLSGLLFKENVSFVLNPSDLLHIYKRHFGKNETDGRNIPLTIEDIRNISDIITNPDKVVYAREKDGQKRNMFFFLKGTADGSYNLMEIYSDSKGNLTAKSFFKSKEGVSQRAMLLHESSTLTSVTDGATLSDDAKLPKFFELSTDEDAESLERAGTGAYSDAEVSMEGDPWSKAWGESIRTKRQQKQFAEKERNRMRERAKSLSSVLGIDIEVIEEASTLKGKKQRAKGWYDTKTGKITVVVSNHNSASDMEATILHEAVAHHGLRQLLGEHFDEFLDKVYEAAENNIKEQIDLLAIRNGWNRRVATEEYLAGLAERTDFDRAQEHVGGWFDKIKRFFFDMLFKAGFKHITPGSIGDNELRYILWRSYQNLANPGRYRAFEWEAEDVAMQYKLQVGEYDANSNNAGTAADEDIRFRDGDFTPRDRVLAAQQYERMLSRGSWQFREATQDSMLGLKTLYESILGSNLRIENVDGYENAYLYENRMSSANNGEQHQYFSRFMKPLLESIHKLCGSKELDRRILTDYMIAKHGLERNKYMRNEAAGNGEETERDFAGLCGLTGEDDWQVAETVAQQMVDDYEADHDTAELWNNVKKATNATLEKIYLSGLISEDTYNKVLGMYDFYIPLRGWDETTSDEVYGYLTSKDGPLMGSVFKTAEGRESKADDPIATIAMMADDAIRQGNRNIMKQRFLNFVYGNPSDLVSINEMWLQHNDVTDEWEPVFADLQPDMTHAEVESEIAKFEAKMEALRTAEPDKYKKGRDARNIPYKVVRGNLNEHQVLVKRNGRTYIITINGNPRAAQALNGLTNPNVDMGGVIGNMLKLGEYVNRQLSAFYTTRNPDFVVSNFLRDMLYSNCMTWVKENPRYALRFHKNFGKVNPLSLRRLLSKWENDNLSDSNYLEKMFKEFMLNGGETGYTSVKDIEGHKRTIASELKKQGSAGRKAWSALGMQLDLLNRSAENCARFAAFLTSREMGRTLDRSIYDAKEVSVNFNKKGSGGKFVNATGQKFLGKLGSYLGGGGRIAYVFWNAGIQGMTNFGRAGKRNLGKALGGAAALFTLGYVIPLLAQMLGGGDGDDDDKNAYYNLPEYVRRSNICFKAGEQWITIPLPVEYRAIYGMGELACGVISGNERYNNSELTRQMASQVSQIMPLDMLEGGGGISPFIPSAFKPMTEAYILNKGWTGLPVYKDTPYNKYDPEWTKAYQSADQHLVAFAKWLNETSGGNDYKKGAIDINPAKLEYLLSGTFGGAVSTTGKLKKMGETALGEREFEWRNMLLANRVIKSGDERTANRKLQNEYFKYLNEYEETDRLRKKYENAADNGIFGYAERANFLYNSPEYLRFEIFEEYKPDIDAIREEIKEETDPDAKKELHDELFATMRELVDELHRTGK